MSLLVILFSALLFFVLSPGILLRLPKNGDKYTVAGVHALVFALVFGLTHKFVWRLGRRLRLEGMEGMDGNVNPVPPHPKK
jgi:hypothetical protein